MRPAAEVLYGPDDVKLHLFAVCYTDDVSYEHVGYRQVGLLNVDRLRTASWLCAASSKHTICCSIITLCACTSSALHIYCLAFRTSVTIHLLSVM